MTQQGHSRPDRDYDARDALADAAASTHATADRVRSPWWYHAGLGVVMGAIVLALGFDLAAPAKLAISAGALAAVVALALTFRRVTGMWWGPAQLGPRARTAWIATIVVVVVAMAVVFLVEGRTMPVILLAIATGVLTAAGGFVVDSRLRDDIRAGDATLARAA